MHVITHPLLKKLGLDLIFKNFRQVIKYVPFVAKAVEKAVIAHIYRYLLSYSSVVHSSLRRQTPRCDEKDPY